jgi:hypothetical protein
LSFVVIAASSFRPLGGSLLQPRLNISVSPRASALADFYGLRKFTAGNCSVDRRTAQPDQFADFGQIRANDTASMTCPLASILYQSRTDTSSVIRYGRVKET